MECGYHWDIHKCSFTQILQKRLYYDDVSDQNYWKFITIPCSIDFGGVFEILDPNFKIKKKTYIENYICNEILGLEMELWVNEKWLKNLEKTRSGSPKKIPSFSTKSMYFYT